MSTLAKTFALVLLSALGAAQIGCRACGTCHDYDSPVANCSCQSCGGAARSGSSITGGYCQGDEATAEEAMPQMAKRPVDKIVR